MCPGHRRPGGDPISLGSPFHSRPQRPASLLTLPASLDQVGAGRGGLVDPGFTRSVWLVKHLDQTPWVPETLVIKVHKIK